MFVLSRLNREPPQISFKKKEKGGINLQTLVPQSELDLDMVKTSKQFISLGPLAGERVA